MSDNSAKRIGMAEAGPRGEDQRHDRYAIYDIRGEEIYVEYTGYRIGSVQTGLALGGPGWRPPIRYWATRENFETVRIFANERGFDIKDGYLLVSVLPPSDGAPAVRVTGEITQRGLRYTVDIAFRWLTTKSDHLLYDSFQRGYGWAYDKRHCDITRAGVQLGRIMREVVLLTDEIAPVLARVESEWPEWQALSAETEPTA